MPRKTYIVAKDYLSPHLPTGAPAPLAVWDLDGTVSSLLDRGTNGHDLVLHAGTEAYANVAPNDFVGFDCRSADNYVKAPAIEDFRIARDRLDGADAAMTLECVVSAKVDAERWVGCWGSGESEATNFLYDIAHNSSSRYFSFNEYGDGSDINIAYDATPPRLMYIDNDLYLQNYIVLTVDTTGNIRRLWENGVLIEEVNTTKARKETSGNTQVLYIGGAAQAIVYSVRITPSVYTDDQIREVWESIKGEVEVYHEESNFNQAAPELDSVELLSMGGPLPHSHPQIPRGWSQPGPAQQPYPANPEVFNSPMSQAGPERDSVDVEGIDSYVFGRDEWGPYKPHSALDDEVALYLGEICQYNAFGSVDLNGNQHFHSTSNLWYYNAFVYDTTSEPWRDPTSHADFTGYATDGKHYTNGVEDAGPVYAPWYTETPSADRGNRPEFPVRALIVISIYEITIFDLDNFPTDLSVWMRIRIPTGTSAYWMFGYDAYLHMDCEMVNGVLYCGAQPAGTAQGRLHWFDFKRDGEVWGGQLIDSTNHWKLNPGVTSASRHDATGLYASGASSYRLTNNYIYRLSAFLDPDNINRQWLVIGGEDTIEVIFLENNEIADNTQIAPTPAVDQGDYRKVDIGFDGMLWWAQGPYVVRNGYGYQGGGMIDPTNRDDGMDDILGKHPYVRLPYDVHSMVVGKNHVYAATDVGVYAIHKTTLNFWLAYTVVGGGGGGRVNNPPDGELLLGDNPRVDATHSLGIHHARLSDYLSISTWWINGEGAIAVIRLYDDIVIHKNKQGLPPNPMSERGAYFCRAYTV